MTFKANFGRSTVSDPAGTPYTAYFTVTGIPTPPPTVTANTITFDPNGVPPATSQNPNPTNSFETYNINPPTPNPFQGANLSASATGGAYDVNSGQLLLSGTSVTVTQAGPVNIASVVLYYRTRPLNGAAVSAFQPITLTETGSSTSTTKTFVLDPSQAGTGLSQPNLIATPAVTQAGTYVLEVYYQANGFNSATGNTVTITDPPTANTYYTANFTVSGTLAANTIWTGGFNDNWFDVRNWSNGVPNAGINALVRDLGVGNSVPYPNVNSDSRKTTAAGAVLYDNTNSGPARARNLVLGGTSQASRSICRLEQGQLQVYGDFSNIQDSFIQREGTIMEFAGTNQTISNGSFIRVDISGGGNKTLSGIMNISQSLNFLTGVSTGDQPAATNPYTAPNANAGVLSTNISNPGANVVILSDRGLVNSNNGAQLTGETDASFLYGFVRTSRVGVLVGETRTYGNMGMTLTFGDAANTNNPGIVEVTRNTVEAYSPVAGRFGIRRIFGVRPSDPQTTTGGLVAQMVFRYRDAETRNLNGPNTITPGTGSIPEPNLIIFLSTNSGNTFGAIGRDGAVDVANNTVTKTGVTNFATFTLGDQNNPLPVRLTAFDAKRLGNNALVTWQTATEENSKGYEVQSSTDGKEFRTVAYVPSAAPNSTKLTNYSYEDKTTYSAKTVYYRLHQLDLDGKDAYFGPRTVNFDGKAVAATLVAYPNPYDSNDELHLAVQSDEAGQGRLRITDMTGRTVREESIELSKGVSDMPVSGVKELKSGIYMVRVTLPSGAVQNLKVVKQ
ncbi:T9SS type A sorting domain-containing protein [Hymenobacter monticola]